MTPHSPKPLSADQLQRLDNLIALDSARLQALERDLQCFRDLILPRPEALRRELLGYAEEQRARLTDTQHWALEVLCTHPDYLAPLGFTREETSHTRFLTWLLGPARTTPLRDGPAKAVWGVLHRAWDQQGKDDPAVLDKNRALATPELPPDGLAQAEVDLGPPGRIDVDWTFPGAKLLIEAKVDAKPSGGRPPRYEKWLTEQNQPAANHTQLERYRTWLNLQHVKRLQRVKHRDPALVLLDLYAHTPSGDDLENDARPKTDSGGAEGG